MEMSTERHVTNAFELARLAKVVRFLMTQGYTEGRAIFQVSSSFGMTRCDVIELLKLM